MKNITLTLIGLVLFLNSKSQIFSTKSGIIAFYSYTPVEDIKAENKEVVAIFRPQTKDLVFSVENARFEFKNKLMQEHFNEKYMESEKYPKSTFKGQVIEDIDYTKDGTHAVTVTGTLNIHGVEKQRTISGTIIIKGGTIQFKSNFKVKVADHKITIPTIVAAKIAEEIEVTVDAVLSPKK